MSSDIMRNPDVSLAVGFSMRLSQILAAHVGILSANGAGGLLLTHRLTATIGRWVPVTYVGSVPPASPADARQITVCPELTSEQLQQIWQRTQDQRTPEVLVVEKAEETLFKFGGTRSLWQQILTAPRPRPLALILLAQAPSALTSVLPHLSEIFAFNLASNFEAQILNQHRNLCLPGLVRLGNGGCLYSGSHGIRSFVLD